MSDISLDLHLVWFWPGFALVLLVAGVRLGTWRTRTGGTPWGLVARTALAVVGAVASGVASWVVAALVGGWF